MCPLGWRTRQTHTQSHEMNVQDYLVLHIQPSPAHVQISNVAARNMCSSSQNLLAKAFSEQATCAALPCLFTTAYQDAMPISYLVRCLDSGMTTVMKIPRLRERHVMSQVFQSQHFC